MDLNRIEKKKIKATENLTLKLSESLDRGSLFLTIEYLKGKFVLEKAFSNSFDGKEQLEKTIKEFSSEERIKQHFGI